MVSVRKLRWSPANVSHVARHGVTPAEVEAICHGEHVALQSRDWRLVLIGMTPASRFITTVIEPEGEDAYFVVTARPASRRERAYYRQETGNPT